MPSRSRSLALASAALLGASFLATACNPASSPLSDPREVLRAAVAHLRAAQTVHLEATVDGTVALSGILGGPGASGRGLGLTGSHLSGDLDLAVQAAAIRFEVPALLGLEGEVRQLGTETYLESSLTSRGWHRITGSELPIAVGHPIEWLTGLAAWLDRPATVPVRLDDAACSSGMCYVVRVTVGRAEIRALASTAPDVAAALAEARVTLELRVDRASLVVSEAVFQIDLGTSGALTVSTTFSHWDAAVAVEAPPASEIVPGPLLP